MKKIIEKVPIPLSGVMLGCAALGNLLQSYSEGVRLLFGGIAFLLLLLLLCKLILFPQKIREDLKNPMMASVAATFPMGIMLLSVYAKPVLGMASQAIWFLAILLHLILMVYFTVNFLMKLEMSKVFASYFIVYVGIAVVGITAPAYEKTSIGTAAFWFGFVCLLGLLVLIGYRYIRHPQIPEPAQPLFCIFAAPASLCLAAYMQSVADKRLGMIYFLMALSTLLYLLSFIRLFSLLRLKFYPSYASFTFPFVISGIALKQATGFLAASGKAVGFLPYLVIIETVIAGLLVCYTLIRFAIFLFSKPGMEVLSKA